MTSRRSSRPLWDEGCPSIWAMTATIRRVTEVVTPQRHPSEDCADRRARMIEINVPRDRAGTRAPDRRQRQRRLTDVDEVVLSLYARGLTTGEISAFLLTSTARRCRRTRISRITDRRGGDDNWHTRPVGARTLRCSSTLCGVKIRRRPGRPTAGLRRDRGGLRAGVTATCWACGPAKETGESGKYRAGGAHRS